MHKYCYLTFVLFMQVDEWNKCVENQIFQMANTHCIMLHTIVFIKYSMYLFRKVELFIIKDYGNNCLYQILPQKVRQLVIEDNAEGNPKRIYLNLKVPLFCYSLLVMLVCIIVDSHKILIFIKQLLFCHKEEVVVFKLSTYCRTSLSA